MSEIGPFVFYRVTGGFVLHFERRYWLVRIERVKRRGAA